MTSLLKADGHIFCGVYIEFKDIVELSWCGVISSTPHEQANTVFIIIAEFNLQMQQNSD